MTCKHITLSCMSSLICVSQKITIVNLNILLYLHCQNGFVLYKPELDHLSFVLFILENNYIQLRHNLCPWVVPSSTLSEP